MKNLIALILLSGFSVIAFAQPHSECSHEEKMEKIKAKKVAYITDELDLTVDEAQKFWPLYNEMEAKHKEIKEQRRANKKELKKNIETLTDNEIEDLIDKQMDLIVEEAMIEKEYYQKYKKVLSIRKVSKLHHAEKEFTRELLRELKGHHHGPGPKALFRYLH